MPFMNIHSQKITMTTPRDPPKHTQGPQAPTGCAKGPPRGPAKRAPGRPRSRKSDTGPILLIDSIAIEVLARRFLDFFEDVLDGMLILEAKQSPTTKALESGAQHFVRE